MSQRLKFSGSIIFEFNKFFSFKFFFKKTFSFKINSCYLRTLAYDLRWRQHCRSCFWSRNHPRRILAPNSRLAGFWLSLSAQLSYMTISYIRTSFCPQRFTKSSTSCANLPSFRFCTCFWLFRTLVQLLETFTSPPLPDHDGICLSRFEWFSQILVTLTGWHEWSTGVFHPSENGLVWVLLIPRDPHILLSGVLICLAMCWMPHRQGFGCPWLQSWSSCHSELVSHRLQLKFGAPGWLNFQTIFFWGQALSILTFYDASMNAFNSFAAPTKFFPLSLMMVFG